jgi:ABC-type amino acid transport substrate-binding protein
MTRRFLTFIATAAALIQLAGGTTAQADTLGRIRETGKLRLGHRADARPFSYEGESGRAAGYSIALCQQIADAVKTELGLASLAIEEVKVGVDDRFDAVESGKVDLLCGADTDTLERRKKVAFSIPIFPSGIGALLRTDAPRSLSAVLEGREPPYQPRWRGSPSLAEVLEKRVLSAQSGTTAAEWLAKRRDQLGVNAQIVDVESYAQGVKRVLLRSSDALFGDRAILLDAAAQSPSAGDLVVLERQYTYEPIALVGARADDDFLLLVDRTLSRLYRSGKIAEVYTPFFGKPDESTLTFFRFAARPD